MNRRGFLFGGGALIVAAPAVIRIPGLLMPIKAPVPEWDAIGVWTDIETLPPGIYGMTLKEVAFQAYAKGLFLTFRVEDRITERLSDVSEFVFQTMKLKHG